MYERFTDRARRVMELANIESQLFQVDTVCTEHIFIGILKEGNGVAAQALQALRVELHDVYKLLKQHGLYRRESSLKFQPRTLPCSSTVSALFDQSAREAEALGHTYIGTEHLLLGLVTDPGWSVRFLHGFGLTSEQVRSEIMKCLRDAAIAVAAKLSTSLPKDPIHSEEPAHMDLRVIREPAVYLVGRQQVDGELDLFLADHGVAWQSDTKVAGEYLAEAAGRLCYLSYARPRPGGNKAYLDHILEVGHGSVLEHAVWNFIFVRCSRSLTHELVRHRHFSFSQLSQRYVDESVAEYVEPDCIAADPALHALWLEAVAHAHQAYMTLVQKLQDSFADETDDRTLRRKLARQAARSVLPNATETKIFVSANARALRHFIELRASRHADPEIRKLAVTVLRIMQTEAPNLFADYHLQPLPDGTFEAVTPHRKV